MPWTGYTHDVWGNLREDFQLLAPVDAQDHACNVACWAGHITEVPSVLTKSTSRVTRAAARAERCSYVSAYRGLRKRLCPSIYPNGRNHCETCVESEALGRGFRSRRPSLVAAHAGWVAS